MLSVFFCFFCRGRCWRHKVGPMMTLLWLIKSSQPCLFEHTYKSVLMPKDTLGQRALLLLIVCRMQHASYSYDSPLVVVCFACLACALVACCGSLLFLNQTRGGWFSRILVFVFKKKCSKALKNQSRIASKKWTGARVHTIIAAAYVQQTGVHLLERSSTIGCDWFQIGYVFTSCFLEEFFFCSNTLFFADFCFFQYLIFRTRKCKNWFQSAKIGR